MTIEVTFIDAATGQPLGKSFIPAENLPQSFARNTNLELAGEYWHVRKAEPPTAEAFIRTGKLLPVTQTELRIVFRRPPPMHFIAHRTHSPEPNQLVIKLDPTTGVRLLVDAHRAGRREPEQINMDMEFAQEGGEGPAPYEVLLHAAMQGDSTRFTRQDGVEEAWRVMQPLLDAPPPVHPYAPGTWGPEAANELTSGYGRWHQPWVAT